MSNKLTLNDVFSNRLARLNAINNLLNSDASAINVTNVTSKEAETNALLMCVVQELRLTNLIMMEVYELDFSVDDLEEEE